MAKNLQKKSEKKGVGKQSQKGNLARTLSPAPALAPNKKVEKKGVGRPSKTLEGANAPALPLAPTLSLALCLQMCRIWFWNKNSPLIKTVVIAIYDTYPKCVSVSNKHENWKILCNM